MRFESKHCFFKQWALKSSFKNICKSLVTHNQLYKCSQNVHEKHPIFSSEVDMGPVSEVKNVHYVEGKIKDFLGIEQVEHIYIWYSGLCNMEISIHVENFGYF